MQELLDIEIRSRNSGTSSEDDILPRLQAGGTFKEFDGTKIVMMEPNAQTAATSPANRVSRPSIYSAEDTRLPTVHYLMFNCGAETGGAGRYTDCKRIRTLSNAEEERMLNHYLSNIDRNPEASKYLTAAIDPFKLILPPEKRKELDHIILSDFLEYCLNDGRVTLSYGLRSVVSPLHKRNFSDVDRRFGGLFHCIHLNAEKIGVLPRVDAGPVIPFHSRVLAAPASISVPCLALDLDVLISGENLVPGNFDNRSSTGPLSFDPAHALWGEMGLACSRYLSGFHSLVENNHKPDAEGDVKHRSVAEIVEELQDLNLRPFCARMKQLFYLKENGGGEQQQH